MITKGGSESGKTRILSETFKIMFLSFISRKEWESDK